MPIYKNISREYRSKAYNGDDFTGSPSDFAGNLVGNAMRSGQATIVVEVGWYASAGISDAWNVTATTISRQAGSFLDDGFSPGQKFAYISGWAANSTTPTDFEATIDSIEDGGLSMTFTVTTGTVTPDASATDVGIRAIGTASENELTGIVYEFGFIANDEPFNTVSKVAGINQRYTAALVGVSGSTTPVTMNPAGTLKDWQSGQAVAAFVSASSFTRTYSIVHDYVLAPWYLDGQRADIAGSVPPEYFEGENCLRHVFNVEVRKALSIPSSAIVARFDGADGFTGWIDENFNGSPTDYAVESIAYTDTATGDPVDALQPSRSTDIEVTLSRTSGAFVAGDRAGLMVSYLPPQSGYQGQVGTMLDNFVFQELYHTEGDAPATSSGPITSLEAALSAGNLVLSATIDYTGAQTATINGGAYMLCADCFDVTLSNQDSDSATMLIDIADYTELPDIDGLATFSTFNILQHNEVLGVDAGAGVILGWNEDGIVADFEFSTDTALSAVIESITAKLIAVNTVTGAEFLMHSYSIDLSGQVAKAGVQLINLQTDRGYILADGDQFNFVRLESGALVGDDQFYSGSIGQKIKWQDWLANLNADAVFFNSSEPNNNLNFQSSNYSAKQDYQIRMAMDVSLSGIDANGIAGFATVRGSSGNLSIFDYGQARGGVSAVMEFFDPDTLADTGGVILTSRDTLMRVTWTAPASLANVYCIHRVQVTGGGDGIEELSSINPYPDNQILKPIAGNTQLKLTFGGGLTSVVSECLISADKVSAGLEYDFSAKIFNYSI